MNHVSSSILRLGISPLSWVNEVLDDLGKGTSADTCLSEAAAAGYAGVELSKIFPKDNPVTLKALLDGHGLSLATGWYNGFLADRSVRTWSVMPNYSPVAVAMYWSMANAHACQKTRWISACPRVCS